MNFSERESIILGALLHDVGKFAQRGGEELSVDYKKNLEIHCCPSYKGKHTHYHVLYSGWFISKYLNAKQVENLVLYHHYPRNSHDKIIQLADWLSSGERRDREIGDVVIEVKEEPLISIFSQIKLDNVSIQNRYYPVLYLTEDLQKHYPTPNRDTAINNDGTGQSSFKNCWKSFCKEAENLIKDQPSFDILFSRVLYLLEKYTLFIPSSAYRDVPEISLYHHLKSTAAIATCIYDLKLSDEELDKLLSAFQQKNEEILKKNDFILLSGDLSGIQEFIYSVTTEHALKGLRGRSFYLQLLSETVARRVLDEFNLPVCNLIYCSGGNFLILLPNLEGYKERISDTYRSINQAIFNAHHGKLGICISHVEFSYKDFIGDGFTSVLNTLKSFSAREKKRKFFNILNSNLFKESETGGERHGCIICAEELSERNTKVCKLCKSFEELSDHIKKAKYAIVKKINNDVRNVQIKAQDWQDLLCFLGYSYRFVTQLEGNVDKKNTVIYKLNDTNFLNENENLSGYKFEPFYSPGCTLEELADKSEGVKKYAALRLDVDNLGKIFAEGLHNRTISRISMLSYMLSLFFSMQVRNIVEKYRDKSIVVYSGGDDLFVLACWSVLPLIAREIYENFRKYTCEHPSVTLSGGIFIAPSKKFPVYHSAKQAEEAEKMAKHSKGKNRITYLDTVLKWDEFAEVEKITDKLVELIKNKHLPRSLLAIFYSSYEDIELAQQNKISMPRIWRLFYAIKRFIERYATDEEIKNSIIELLNKFVSDYKLKKNFNVSISWADYLTRKE